jgi:succinate dehydrogenase / fumarate reductase flavoprotein subunit
MSRTAEGLTDAIGKIVDLRDAFWNDVKVPGEGAEFNQELEKAGRVADHFELAELMCRDALQREESCGGHFREEYQTDEGEALRNDEDYCSVTVWEYTGAGKEPVAHQEELEFETVELAQRSYK